jgi:hypothetical protein
MPSLGSPPFYCLTKLASMALILLIVVIPAIPAQSTSESAASVLSDSLDVLNQAAPALGNVQLTGNVQWIAGTERLNGSATMVATQSGPSKLLLAFTAMKRGFLKYPPGSSQQSIQLAGSNSEASAIAPHNLIAGANWFFPEYFLQRLTSANTLTTFAPSCSQSICLVSRPQATSPSEDRRSLRMYGVTTVFDSNKRLVQAEFNEHPDNQPYVSVPVKILYDNYRMTSGHWIPYHMQQFVAGTLHLDITVSTVDADIPLTSSVLELR